VTDAPIAQAVHSGGVPAGPKQQTLAAWLTANGINPNLVAAADPILVLPIPYEATDDDGPWMVQVIVFSQFYMRDDGTKEHNLLTRQPVTFQRTVPLRAPFPTETTTDGEDHGQTDRQAAQEAPQELIRDPQQAQVSDPRQGPRPERPGEGQAVRNEGAAEESPRRRDEAVPQPEEDRQEEVGAR